MAANEATRLRSEAAEPRAEEGSAARLLARAPEAVRTEARAVEDTEAPAEEDAPPSEDTLAALERAADNIRPSWHGTELASAPYESGPAEASFPSALPPPPALPSFSSFPSAEPARYYRADSTVRTAALLPERLANLLNQPRVARVRSDAQLRIARAVHWLRTRPRARGALLAVAVLLLAWLLWPSAPDTPSPVASVKPAVSAAPRSPSLPAPPPSGAAQLPAQASTHEAAEAAQPESPPAAVGTKKREKRKTTMAKPAPSKPRKPTKAVAAPAR